MWDYVLRLSSISFDRYGFKIQKVSRCRAAAPNEIILATKQEFFYKSSSRTNQDWHCIIRFFINAALLNVYFILCYFHHLFFRKEKCFFECLYFSEYDIRMSLYVFFSWKRGHHLSTYATGGEMGGSSKMPTAAYRGRRCHVLCVCTHLHYLFSCFASIFFLKCLAFLVEI